jgi:hypothetical protein
VTHYWRVRKFLPDRFGQHCRILAVGKMNSILIVFEDGFKVLTCRYFVRKIKSAITKAVAKTR